MIIPYLFVYEETTELSCARNNRFHGKIVSGNP